MKIDGGTLLPVLFASLAVPVFCLGEAAPKSDSIGQVRFESSSSHLEAIVPPGIVWHFDPLTHRRWPVSLDWSRPIPAVKTGIGPEPIDRNLTGSSKVGLNAVLGRVRWFRMDSGSMDGPCGIGDVLVVGDNPPDEIMTIDRDTTIIGDICIVNRGELRVEGAELTLIGDINVRQSGRMHVSGGGLQVPEEFRLQFGCQVMDSARFEIDHSDVIFNGQNWSLTCAGNASARVDHCTFPFGSITGLLLEESTMEMSHCTRPGEFIPMEHSSLTISNCDSAIAWFTFSDSSGGTFEAPPRDTLITHYEFPTPSVTGIDYRFVIDSTSSVIPGLLCSEQTALTVENSDLISLGIIFWEGIGDTLRLEGFVDDSDYPDYTLDLPDRTLRLMNTHVGAWNVYPFDTAILRMNNDIFGEIMISDSARADIYYSICDGTGGHVMSEIKSELVIAFSSMVAQVIARNRSLMLFVGTNFPSFYISADGSAVMIFMNSDPVMRPSVLDTALTIEAFVGLLSAPAVESDIPVTGTALMTPGPDNRFRMDHYLLDYAPGVDPQSAEWTRIDSVGGPVYQDTLGIWDTRGLEPGYYMLRLTVRSGYLDTFRFDMPLVVYVYLNESTGIGEGNDHAGVPRTTVLMQNAPNPFNPSTDIRFELSKAGPVRLAVYDARGRLIKVLIDKELTAGGHLVHWEGTDDRETPVSSGVYICRLEADDHRFTRKMVLVR